MGKTARRLRRRVLMGGILFLIGMAFSLTANAQWASVLPPEVSANWGLNKIRILSGVGWAVGVDGASQQGVVLQFKNHVWSVFDLPNVSSNWELTSISFTSANDVWAVGVDFSSGSRKGIMLHLAKGLWTIVTPPYVSLDWGLNDIFFGSSSEGWAVGADYSSHKGILLHFKGGVWTSYVPSNLSLDWGLSGIHMISVNDGWAVGVDHTNGRGVLLHYERDPANKSTTNRTYIWQIVLPPQINGDWELSEIDFSQASEGVAGEGWAVGVNHANKRGAMLHFVNSNWAEVIPPSVSSDWELNSVHFLSNTAGWVAGIDHANKQGVSLQFDKGLWTVSSLPTVSSDWDLGSIRFLNVSTGWAVGTDFVNKKGAILRFSTATNETISTPSTPNGPTNIGIGPNVLSTFFTGESLSNLDHSVQYFFDWGDGTNSGWLPAGTVGASKSWTSAGTYQVKAQARCDTDTSVVSKFSSSLSVIVSNAPTPVILLSPADGTAYTACSLYSLPTFTWEADGSFTGYEIQFSKTESFDAITASDKISSTSVKVNNTLWKKVLTTPGATSVGSSSSLVSLGGPMFWRVIGTRSDKTTVISNTLSILIDSPQPVGNLLITNASKSSTPTLSWDNQCNIKFKVWFGNTPNFSKKTSVSFTIKNPDDNGGVFAGTLNSSQWTSVQGVVGRVSGAPIYWYVESWDGANRHVVSQPPERFVLVD
jgi:hypothetical protein